MKKNVELPRPAAHPLKPLSFLLGTSGSETTFYQDLPSVATGKADEAAPVWKRGKRAVMMTKFCFPDK